MDPPRPRRRRGPPLGEGLAMQPAEIFARLQSLVGDAVTEFTPAVAAVAPPPPAAPAPAKGPPKPAKIPDGPRDAFCKVQPAKWLDVARMLRDDPELRFDFLQCVTAVDWPKTNVLQVVYHLYSYPLRHSFVVKADLPRDNPTIASVASLWPVADWNEREQFDLLGVGFSGHPDLRRVMLPDDWVGHPMRKDWKEPEKYRDMPTTRPSPLDLLVIYDKAPDDKKRLKVVTDGDGEPAATEEAPE